MSFLFFGCFGGLLATAAFSGLLFFFERTGITKGNMIVALGSLLTHSRERAAQVGLIIHVASGVFFGLIYTWGLMAIGVHGFGTILLLGMLFGVLHGAIVAVGLVASVSDFHPLPEFQNATWVVGFTHGLAHVVYGGVMGFVIASSGLVS
ncbi:hypothetical protein [Cerasicoccus arenae]|uniref:hypothetical protein n=1 Tax=Cerasicoccus arenae TaxID=424488 RepID=UPI00167395FB|nr:hypothetical protein [Cerasicoccus arenae]MBK1857389.1 hypothetical protein [Cerasicoccus arenae]